METKTMLPGRFIVLATCLTALIAALQVQTADAAFGISSAFGVTVSPAPLPSVKPGFSEGALPVIFPEILNANVKSLSGLPVDHDGSSVTAAPTISGNVGTCSPRPKLARYRSTTGYSTSSSCK